MSSDRPGSQAFAIIEQELRSQLQDSELLILLPGQEITAASLFWRLARVSRSARLIQVLMVLTGTP
jgi:hypothetical protein